MNFNSKAKFYPWFLTIFRSVKVDIHYGRNFEINDHIGGDTDFCARNRPTCNKINYAEVEKKNFVSNDKAVKEQQR